MQQTPAALPRLVMGVVTIFTGALYGHSGLDVLINGYKSKNWNQAIGTVIEGEGETYNPYDPNKVVVPTIQYNVDQKVLDTDTNQYVTVHRQFTSRNYSYTFFGLSRNDVKELKLTEFIQPNSRVKLFYDPQDPKESVVVPGLSYGSLQTTALGLGSIFSGLTFALTREDILSWNGIKKNKVAGGILGFSVLLMLSSFSIPSLVKRNVLKGTEEERKRRWVDPYVVNDSTKKQIQSTATLFSKNCSVLRQPYINFNCKFYSTISESTNNSQENEIYVWGSIGEQSIPTPTRIFDNNPAKKRVFFDGDKIVDVSCGSEHVLFLSDKGNLYALGANQYGQCGKSPSVEQFVREPTKIKVFDESNHEITFKSIHCGRDSNYAINSDGTTMCVFGLNDTAQLGLGYSKVGYSYVPKFVKLPKSTYEQDQIRIENVYCGSRHMFIRCRYEPSGREKLFCWGGNQFGQLGLGHLFNQNEIVEMQLPIELKLSETSITSGMSHTIIYSPSKAFSVGRGTEGQLGYSIKQSPMWKEIQEISSNELKIKHITSGINHSIANVYSEKLGGEQIIGWGTNIFYGSQSCPEIINIPSYGKVAPKNSIDLMTSGLLHSLMRVDKERLYAIGNGQSFQLGQNERSSSESKLVQVLHPNVKGIRKIVAGFSLNVSIGL